MVDSMGPVGQCSAERCSIDNTRIDDPLGQLPSAALNSLGNHPFSVDDDLGIKPSNVCVAFGVHAGPNPYLQSSFTDGLLGFKCPRSCSYYIAFLILDSSIQY
ncbi:hypothetical protein CDL15_Pgr011612 [Punica granatum]|nr:hypothetical protein CDL15_Pgr011612 [Punica granatum]